MHVRARQMTFLALVVATVFIRPTVHPDSVEGANKLLSVLFFSLIEMCVPVIAPVYTPCRLLLQGPQKA